MSRKSRDIEKLTPCEARTLVLLVAGLSNRQIADATFVSVNTVKFHLKNVYGKIGATGRLHAVSLANEIGLFAWRGNDLYIRQSALTDHVTHPVGHCANRRVLWDSACASKSGAAIMDDRERHSIAPR